MTTDHSHAHRWIRRIFAGVVMLAALVLVAGLWTGCRQYPPVSSREALALVRALDTACNTHDEKRLTQVEQRLAELERQGKVTAAEKAGFDRIIGMAKAGKWEDAEQAAFKFAQDQLGQGDNEPDHPTDHKHQPKKPKGK